MYRAEKSSSRICRNREVERAQELHRKKIDGVKSYLTATISPSTRPAAMKPVMGSMFRRFKAPGTPSQSSLHNNTSASYCGSTTATTADDGGSDSGENDGTLFYGVPSGGGSGFGLEALDDATPQHCGDLMDHALAKSDEFRSIDSVFIHHHSSVKQQHHYGKVPPPPVGARKKTLNGSFRTRRLKEIQVDNVGLFERIKKSAAHYCNDNLKREWEQNVSYLSSICEFPLAPVLLANGARSSNVTTVTATFKTPVRHLHEQLPSIHQPVVVHPIRAIPTSPRKLQLNLSPAFRSLRKVMPQQPALPPISASSSTAGHTNSSSVSNFGALASPSSSYIGNDFVDFGFAGGAATATSSASMTGYHFHSTGQKDQDGDGDDEDASETLNDSEVASLPCRATCVGSPFIGDLNSPLRANHFETPSASSSSCVSLNDERHKYQLLKLGRFVGGAYLVITVFCGDGIKNPYGFDVLAFDRESACEFKLSITKEMTHELLDTISSSSQAAVTAAAAGTNLSMVEIAKSICEHMNFTRFESGLGEMVFLMSSGVGGVGSSDVKSKSDAALLVDCLPSTIAFCIHQVIEIGGGGRGGTSSDPVVENAQDSNANSYDGNEKQRKRRMHVFGFTRPQKSSMVSPKAGYNEATSSHSGNEDDGALSICFQICGTNNSSSSNAPTQSSVPSATASSSEFKLEVEIDLDELYEIVSKQFSETSGDTFKKKRHKQRAAVPPRTSVKDRISVERAVVAAIRHLYIVSVPTGGDGGTDEKLQLKQVLVVNQHVNALSIPVSSTSSSVLEASRSRALLDKKSTSRRRLLPRGHKSSSSSQSLLCSSVLESGVIWKNAYVLARVVIDSDHDDSLVVENGEVDGSASSNSAAVIHKMPKFIQDLDTGISISVYNPLSSNYSERKLSPEQIDCLAQNLETVGKDSDGDFHESTAFLKQVLKRLQIEVDLFGVEVLMFPSLGIKQPLNSHTEQQQLRHGSSSRSILNASANTSGSLSRRSPGRQGSWHRDGFDGDGEFEGGVKWDAATIIQAHVRGYLFRKQYYYEDEDEHDDTSDEHGEALDLHTEMQFQSDSECSRQQSRHCGDNADSTAIYSHSQHANYIEEEELVGVEETTDPSEPDSKADPPPSEAAVTLKRGTKRGSRYCLIVVQLQSAVSSNGDGMVSTKQVFFGIGALGQLDEHEED